MSRWGAVMWWPMVIAAASRAADAVGYQRCGVVRVWVVSSGGATAGYSRGRLFRW